MRELKFRAWDGEKLRYMPNMFVGVGQIGFSDEHYVDIGHLDNEEVEITQFTGIKDKNGVEIYEGDIIKLIDSGDWVSDVRWDEASASFETLNFSNSEWRQAEVIGNIYENPELLKEKQND